MIQDLPDLLKPKFPDLPCMKKALRKKQKRRSSRQHPGTMSAPGPGDKPLVNRSSCSLIRFTWGYDRASEASSGTFVFVILGVEMEGRPLAEPFRAALPRSRPAPICSSRLDDANHPAWSRPRYVRVLDSIGKNIPKTAWFLALAGASECRSQAAPQDPFIIRRLVSCDAIVFKMIKMCFDVYSFKYNHLMNID